MARSGTPWGIVVVAALSALITGGALVAAATLADRGSAAGSTATSSPVETSVDADGCVVDPCAVLAEAVVGGTTIELVVDSGATSGRLRIGGVESSWVVEATITDMGAVLTADSLQCVADALSACLLRGPFGGGIAGQVVVGRSDKWSEAGKPFVSDAGYLALANVLPDIGPEVVAAQYQCDRAATPDCSGSPVFAQVFPAGASDPLGCTKTYPGLDSLPGYPLVDLDDVPLRPCG